MANFLTIFRTVRHLKPIQIWYQVWYRLKKKLFGKIRYKNPYGEGHSLEFNNEVHNRTSLGKGVFTFLNVNHDFEGAIDWNYNNYGKLWTYNLNYFDFLNQSGISKNEGVELINDYINKYPDHLDGFEPYPTSLRIINWVKFLSQHTHRDKRIDDVLGEDVKRLTHNLEYHLLANHLLENAFALFMASYYFKNKALYNQAAKLLKNQLDEQILNDGGHFELSPMYHQLMLFRVLDAVQMIRVSDWMVESLEKYLASIATKMVSWLRQMTFCNGDIPLFNDAAKNINPETKALLDYADFLNIEYKHISLSDSGYRVLKNEMLECICDIGNIQPSYQPGHAHADTLGFILFASNKPFLVEAGTSTYETNDRRKFERSTSAHNTVTFLDQNSSEVWSSFRVGRRAQVKIIKDNSTKIIAEHNGFDSVTHNRSWTLGDNRIVIEDSLAKNSQGVAYFHLHPSVSIISKSENEVISSSGNIIFNNQTSIKVEDYHYSEKWNEVKTAKVLNVKFVGDLKSIFLFDHLSMNNNK